MRQVKHIVALFLLWMVCTGANAIVYSGVCGVNGDNLKWSLDTQNGVLEITGTGMMMDYNDVDAPWKKFNVQIKDVIISNTVTSIGKRAFSSCSGLTSVTIPASINNIGERAFFNCSGLASIVVEDGNVTYDSREGCNAIIEKSTSTLIVGCSNTSIPSNVSSIGNDAFHGCKSLTSIIIPNSVTSIGEWAFTGCSGLASVIIPNSVTSIGEWAFYDCHQLPVFDNIRYADTYSVEVYDKTLQTYKIKEGTRFIGTSMFQGCSNVTSVTIPNTVISIGAGAFAGQHLLTSISIPNSVTSIGESAFQYMGLTSVTIPNSVTSIGKKAFYQCYNLKSVMLSNSLTTFGDQAFCQSGLTTIDIPNSVTDTGYGTFANCKSLISVTIPNSVTTIGYGSFYGCASLDSIYVPKSVTSISEIAFACCPNLKTVTVCWETPLKIQDFVFDASTISSENYECTPVSTATLYVPHGTKSKYSATNVWKDFGTIIESPLLANSISLNISSAEMALGRTCQLIPTVLPNETTNKTINWSTSDASVATVNNGLVTAKKLGTATITATTTDGSNLSATCEVIVNSILATSIVLNSSNLNLYTGQSTTLSATIKPDNATNKNVEWSSSNNSVATVSNGIVKAVAAGTCVIKAKTTDGSNLECGCNVTVVDVPVSVLSFDKESVELLVEDETTITASVFPSNATNPTLAWTSSNGNVAIVNNGKVTAIGAGNAVISARTTDGTNKVATCNVKVKKHSQTIDWDQTLTSLVCGGELVELNATASSGLPITYKSSNDDVVSIFDMGKTVYLNPISSGTSKITATQTGTYYYEAVSTTKDVSVVESNSIWEVTPDKYRFVVYTVNGIHVGDFSKSELVIFMQQNELKGLYIVNGKKVIIK